MCVIQHTLLSLFEFGFTVFDIALGCSMTDLEINVAVNQLPE